MTEEQHVVHHYDRSPRQVVIKLERNSRGYNWEVTATGDTPEDALVQIREAARQLQAEYGEVTK